MKKNITQIIYVHVFILTLKTIFNISFQYVGAIDDALSLYLFVAATHWTCEVFSAILILKFKSNKGIVISSIIISLSILSYGKYIIELFQMCRNNFYSLLGIATNILPVTGIIILSYTILNWSIFSSKWNVELIKQPKPPTNLD